MKSWGLVDIGKFVQNWTVFRILFQTLQKTVSVSSSQSICPVAMRKLWKFDTSKFSSVENLIFPLRIFGKFLEEKNNLMSPSRHIRTTFRMFNIKKKKERNNTVQLGLNSFRASLPTRRENRGGNSECVIFTNRAGDVEPGQSRAIKRN